jgi:hypothetical protein
MNETNSLNCTTVIADEQGNLTTFEPEIDPNEGWTPELRAKLIAMNERFRIKRTGDARPHRDESNSNLN